MLYILQKVVHTKQCINRSIGNIPIMADVCNILTDLLPPKSGPYLVVYLYLLNMIALILTCTVQT